MANSSKRYLLDTHIFLWWTTDGPSSKKFSRSQARVLKKISPENPFYISNISLWEVATLANLGRIELPRPYPKTLETMAAPPLIQRLELSPTVAAEVAALPASFHRDPADRIIVATARIWNATLITNDARIIDAKVLDTL